MHFIFIHFKNILQIVLKVFFYWIQEKEKNLKREGGGGERI